MNTTISQSDVLLAWIGHTDIKGYTIIHVNLLQDLLLNGRLVLTTYYTQT
jgi:hypothetical protein